MTDKCGRIWAWASAVLALALIFRDVTARVDAKAQAAAYLEALTTLESAAEAERGQTRTWRAEALRLGAEVAALRRGLPGSDAAAARPATCPAGTPPAAGRPS